MIELDCPGSPPAGPDGVLVPSTLAYASSALFLLSTPLAHAASILWHGLPVLQHSKAYKKATRGVGRLLCHLLALLKFPISGGKRHTAFQVSAWALWSASILCALQLLISQADPRFIQLPQLPPSHRDVAAGATAVSSFTALLFIVKAMLVYERTGPGTPRPSSDGSIAQGGRRHASSSVEKSGVIRWRPQLFTQIRHQLLASRAGQVLCRHGPAAAVLLMGLLLSATGVLLLLSVEHMPDTPSRLLYCCLSLVCLIIGASSTHGLGGYLQWGRGSTLPPAQHVAATAVPQGATSSCSPRSASQHRPQGAQRGDAAVLPADEADLGFGEPGTLLVMGPVASSFTHSAKAGTAAEAAVQGMQQASQEVSESPAQSAGGAWAFFQPFAGGTVFVVTQAVAWSLFAVSCVLVVAVCKVVLGGMLTCLRHWLLGTSILMLTTQTVLGVSVLTWRNSPAARGIVAAGGRRLQRRLSRSKMASEKEDAKRKDSAVPAVPVPLWVQQVVAKWQQGGSAAVAKHTVTSAMSSAVQSVRQAAYHMICLWVPLIVMYVPAQTFFTFWALSFAFCPSHWAVMSWLVALPLWYGLTLPGEPQHTGARAWPAFQEWLSRHMEASLTWWFGGLRVIADWDEREGPPPADKKYIFGFHPHGLYPAGAGFLPLMPSFRRLVPGIRPVTLIATIIFYVPAIKDLATWLGFRQVSRRTFVRALRDKGAVILCPGGQAEGVYAYASHSSQPSVQPLLQKAMKRSSSSSASSIKNVDNKDESQDSTISSTISSSRNSEESNIHDESLDSSMIDVTDRKSGMGKKADKDSSMQEKAGVKVDCSGAGSTAAGKKASRHVAKGLAPAAEFVVYAGHKGFVRMAIEQQASLVPVLALGEVLTLRNLIHAPAMQRWTYKRVGFPIPWSNVGFWYITPLPEPTPLVYVIGKPIPPPPYSGSGSVSQSDVDAFHAAFYDSLADMYRRHAPDHPAFKDACWTLLDNHTHL